MSRSEAIIIANKYIQLVNESGIPIDKAFLFGSYARNQANTNSDIDILLITENMNATDIELNPNFS